MENLTEKIIINAMGEGEGAEKLVDQWCSDKMSSLMPIYGF